MAPINLTSVDASLPQDISNHNNSTWHYVALSISMICTVLCIIIETSRFAYQLGRERLFSRIREVNTDDPEAMSRHISELLKTSKNQFHSLDEIAGCEGGNYNGPISYCCRCRSTSTVKDAQPALTPTSLAADPYMSHPALVYCNSPKIVSR